MEKKKGPAECQAAKKTLKQDILEQFPYCPPLGQQKQIFFTNFEVAMLCDVTLTRAGQLMKEMIKDKQAEVWQEKLTGINCNGNRCTRIVNYYRILPRSPARESWASWHVTGSLIGQHRPYASY